METQQKHTEGVGSYEITYVVREEADVASLKELLVRYQAEVSREDSLKKVQLSYPIEKVSFAFLGAIIFIMTPERVADFRGDLELESKILRYLITSPVRRAEEVVSGAEGVSSATDKGGEREVSSSRTTDSSGGLSNEALEKKIEEILK